MPRTVLIVDDSEINRKILCNILSPEYSVVEAENGEDAMRHLINMNRYVSAILLDIIMPVMDGYQVLERMGQNPALSQIPVIVITGSSEEGVEKKSLDLGASDFVAKPFDADIVTRRLKNLIRLRETSATINAMQRDRLTGLWNRESFFERAAWAIARRPAGYYVLASLDIDSFKVINDQYGIEKGDRVLRYIAAVLRQNYEAEDCICGRVAADNFIVLYPRRLMGERFAVSSNEQVLVEESAINLTISTGSYVVEDKNLSISAMYDRANIAQRTVKGRYDVHMAVFNEAMRQGILRQQEIVNEMNDAMEEGQFEAWYQPQYNHSTGAPIGAEALVRWRHPVRGLIPPEVFIPVFEKNGFVYELDKYMWEQVCSNLRRWMDEGCTPLPVSVNISRYDLFREDLIEFIMELIEKYNIPAGLLRLEITESAFAGVSERIITVVRQLINYGFTVEIDDFGSGYSSLNTLKDVPAQIVKLDMRFLENTANIDRGSNIIESVVRMVKWLGMSLIAEGVETAEQANYLRSTGCSYVQGYLYARPMPAGEYEALIKNADRGEGLLEYEAVENLDNNSFWDPNSIDTLVFNNYVGGACIFEWHDGKISVVRANEKYAHEIGGEGFTVEQALGIEWEDHMDEDARATVCEAVEKAVATGTDVACEAAFIGMPGGDEKVYMKHSFRAIARNGDRYLIYSTSENCTGQRRSEKEDRDAAARIRAMMTNINGGVSAATLRDGVMDYIFTNLQYYLIFGYTQEQFHAEHPRGLPEIIVPEDAQSVCRAADTAAGTGKPVTAEFRAVKRDGSVIWVRSSGSACFIDGIEGPVHLAVLNDITREKEAEQKMVDALEQLRFLNESAHSLLAQPDTGKGIARVLSMALDYFEGSRAYVAELPPGAGAPRCVCEICAPGVDGSGAGDMTEEEARFWREAFKDCGCVNIKESPEARDSGAGERKILKARGTRSLAAVPLRREGELIGFIGVDDPTRGQERAERLAALGDYMTAMLTRRDLTAKIESDNRALRGLMDDTPGGFVRMQVFPDGHSVPVYVNAGFCRIVGMTEREVLENYRESSLWGVHPDDVEVVRSAIAEMTSTGEARSTKYRLCRGGGGYVWVTIFGRAVTNEAGERFFNVYYTDVSEQETKRLNIREMLPFAFEAMMEDSQDLVFVKDMELRYVRANRRMAEVAGVQSVSELMGRTDMEMLGRELADSYSAVDREVIESGKPVLDSMVSMPDSNGAPRYALTSKYPLRDSMGNIVGIYGIGRDVTEYRTVYERLKLFEDSPMCAMATFEFAPDNVRTLYSSDGFYSYSGYTKEEYLRFTAKDPLYMILEEDRPMLMKAMEDIRLTGTPMDVLFRCRTKTGFRWFNMRGTVTERRGETAIVTAVQFDVTATKLAEEAARIREKEYALAIRQSGKMIYHYSHADNLIEMPEDTAALLGLAPSFANEPESLLKSGLIAPGSAEDYREFFEAIRRGDESGSIVLQRRVACGDLRWFSTSFSTVYDDGGRPFSAIIVLEDITDQREEKEAESLDRSRFMAALNTVYPLIISFNLTQNSFHVVAGSSRISEVSGADGTIDELVGGAADRMEPYYATSFQKRFRPERRGLLFGKTGDSLRIEYRRREGCGEMRWVEAVILRTPNDYNSDITGVIVCRFIDAQKTMEDKLRQAEIDGMTGIYNKTTTEELISQRLQKSGGGSCALIVADLDLLKSINDSLGHAEGDNAIRLMAGLLRAQFRQTDIVGRIGGDEFAAFLNDVTEDKLRSILTVFMRRLSAVRIGKNGDVAVRGSLGVAMGAPGEDSYETMFSRADRALYHVKRNGKNDFAFYTHEMEESAYRYESREGASKWRSSYFDTEELDRLLKAISVVSPMVISGNLTQNSYYVLQHDSSDAGCMTGSGSLDDLVRESAEKLRTEDGESFLKAFDRKKLLTEYERGRELVSFRGRLAESGEEISVDLVFVKSGNTDDVMEITLIRRNEPCASLEDICG